MIAISSIFFFNDTATTEIYTLSLHDALPIWPHWRGRMSEALNFVNKVIDEENAGKSVSTRRQMVKGAGAVLGGMGDRKSTRLNSSHANISYAVFCLKKKINPCPHRYG